VSTTVAAYFACSLHLCRRRFAVAVAAAIIGRWSWSVPRFVSKSRYASACFRVFLGLIVFPCWARCHGSARAVPWQRASNPSDCHNRCCGLLSKVAAVVPQFPHTYQCFGARGGRQPLQLPSWAAKPAAGSGAPAQQVHFNTSWLDSARVAAGFVFDAGSAAVVQAAKCKRGRCHKCGNCGKQELGFGLALQVSQVKV
jgi:hypothetical protein